MKSINKILKNKFTGIVDGIIDQIMRFPVVIFVFVILLLYPSIKTLLLFLLSSFVCVFIQKLVSLQYDVKHVLLLTEFSEKHQGSSFTEYQYPELPLGLSEKQKNMMNSIVYFSKLEMNLGFIYEQNKGTIKEYVSFPFYNLRPFVFLHGSISNCKHIYQKYRLLHEVGHWCYFDYRCWGQNITSVMSFLFLISISIFVVVSPVALFFMFVVGFFWLHQNRRCYNYCVSNDISEVLADAFALWILQDDEDVDVIYSYIKEHEKQRYDKILFYKDWFESPIDVENDKLFQKIIPLKLKSRLLDNRIINFSSATEKLYIPPYRANTLLLICIVCVVFWSNVIVFSDLLWGVGFVALGMVIYVMLVYMCLCIKYRQAQNLLNIG